LAVIGFLSRVGWETLGFLTTLLLVWLAVRKPVRDTLGKVFRVAVGCLGAVVFGFTILIVILVQFEEPLQEAAQQMVAELAEEAGPPEGATAEGESETSSVEEGFGLIEGLSAVGEILALTRSSSREEALESARSLARAGREAGLAPEEIRATIEELVPEDAPWAEERETIAEEAVASLAGREPEADGLPEAALATRDEEEPSWTSNPEAVDSISALESRIQRLETEARASEEALAEARRELGEMEERGVLDWLWSLLDDLGLGFGWAALYMTITHAWWSGTSVGKKLFGLRVVMIDKRPLNWWLSFERAGGEAAGFATGMLGFAQVFWDPNRQAIHDKVSETIVIQDGKSPVPGPWIAEGRAQWSRGSPRTSESEEEGGAVPDGPPPQDTGETTEGGLPG
jgi:hypothetical protein